MSSSLDGAFLSAASTMPSCARIPTHVPAWLMLSMAYSTWYSRPADMLMRQCSKNTLNTFKPLRTRNTVHTARPRTFWREDRRPRVVSVCLPYW